MTAVKSKRRWIRLLPIGAVLGVLAFVAGLSVALRQPARQVDPLTGRPIAGIATDAQWMDRASREQEELPDEAIDLIGISSGMTVADVGAGSGYMTLRLARRVGAAGQVYATDLQPRLLAMIEAKAEEAKLGNIHLIVGTEDSSHLPENAIDTALLVDAYHEFSQPQSMLRSLRRALKPNGRLTLVEYRKEDPSIPIADTHRMSVAEMRTEVQAEGFVFDRAIEQLPRQHILIFRRAPE